MMITILIACLTITSNAFSPEGGRLRLASRRTMPPTTGSRTSMSLDALALDTSALTMLDSFYHTQPYLSAFVTCGFKASAADLVVQSQNDSNDSSPSSTSKTTMATTTTDAVAESSQVDVRRNVAFLLYGGLYSGLMQEYIYNTVFPSVFGTQVTLATVLEEVLTDMTIVTPFLCLPVAYLVKASIAADQSLMDGLRRYVEHVQKEGLLVRYWSLWGPVNCLTFGVIPEHLRIAFIAFVSFFWMMILSNVSSRNKSS